MKINKIIFVLILASLGCMDLISQNGINIHAGITTMTNKDMLITPEGTSHPGYHFGADARLNEGKMYFIVGGQFHNVAFDAQTEKSFFSVTNSMKYIKIRVGLGYQVITINENLCIRGKTLVSINLLSSYPNDLAGSPYSNYNSSTVGATLGLGLDFHNISLDFEIDNGFFKAVNQVDGTEVNFFSVSLGYTI